MSAPDPMPCIADPCPTPLSCSNAGTCSARIGDCLKDQCRSPLACSGWGYCREWNMLSAREYDEALKACRELGIVDPFKTTEYRRHNRENGGSFP